MSAFRRNPALLAALMMAGALPASAVRKLNEPEAPRPGEDPEMSVRSAEKRRERAEAKRKRKAARRAFEENRGKP